MAKELWDAYDREGNRLGFDLVRGEPLPEGVWHMVAEIYAARETDTLGMSSQRLALEIPGAVCLDSLEETGRYLAKIARPGDLILTVGAGDIYLAGEAMLKKE